MVMDEPCRVLIVEDCPDTADSAAKLLTYWHFETAIAVNGSTALEKVPTFRPDIVLLDLGLPDMGGLEVARRLRAMNGLDKTMIVVLSGYGTQNDREQSAQAGCQMHLLKPVDLSSMKAVLLDGLKAFRENQTVGRPSCN
jgi:two-component system CheB/CheR fusion protein